MKTEEKGKGKTIFLSVVLALVALALAGSFLVGYFGLDYNWGAQMTALEMKVEAELLENGDLRITETTTYSYKKRERPYYNNYRYFQKSEMDGIEDISLYDHDQGLWYTFDPGHVNEAGPNEATPDTVYLDGLTSRWELGYHFPLMDKGRRTFTLAYTLKNVAQQYRDADLLYYQFRPADMYPINSLEVELVYPNAGQDGDERGWLHCTAESMLAFEGDGRLRITAEKVPADTFVELRLMLPAGSLPGGGRGHGWDKWQSVWDEEQRWAEEWGAGQRYRWFIAVCTVVGSVLLIVAISLVVRWEHRSDKKTFPNEKEPPYRRSIPSDVSPALAGRLMSYSPDGKKGDEYRENALSASLLNLAHKGWLALDRDAGGKLVVTLLQNGHEAPSGEEWALLGLLRQAGQAVGESFTIEDYKTFTTGHASAAQSAMRQYNSQVEAAFRARGWMRTGTVLRSLSGWLALACAVAAIVVYNLSFFGHGFLFAALLIGACIAGLCAKTRIQLTPKGCGDMLGWQGYMRYLAEFTLVDERGPAEVGLWGQYLVYGTALGMGDVVTKSLGVAYTNLAESAPAGAPPVPNPLHGYFGPSTMFDVRPGRVGGAVAPSSGRGGGAPFGGIASALSDIRATGKAIRSSGVSSSGGSGGGGGGGGSGGGGGGGGSGGGGGGTR